MYTLNSNSSDSQKSFISELTIHFGVEGASKLIFSKIKNGDSLTKNIGINFSLAQSSDDIKKQILSAIIMNSQYLRTRIIKTRVQNLNNGIIYRASLAAMKSGLLDSPGAWTAFIRAENYESTADKHSRTGELIQSFFLEKNNIVFSCQSASADFSGLYLTLSEFKNISQIDLIKDAPSEIQFPLLENPIIYPRQYDSKKVAGYTHRELMNIIKSFRTNHISFDELFGGIRKDKSDKESKDQNPSPDRDDTEDVDDNDELEDDNTKSPDSENKKNNNDSKKAENDHLDYFKDHLDKTLNAEIAALELNNNLQIIEELRSKGW